MDPVTLGDCDACDPCATGSGETPPGPPFCGSAPSSVCVTVHSSDCPCVDGLQYDFTGVPAGTGDYHLSSGDQTTILPCDPTVAHYTFALQCAGGVGYVSLNPLVTHDHGVLISGTPGDPTDVTIPITVLSTSPFLATATGYVVGTDLCADGDVVTFVLTEGPC